MLPPSPRKGGSKSDFSFKIKFNFNRIKSATKFLCVATSSGKYWLKLTYRVVDSRSTLSALLNDVS